MTDAPGPLRWATWLGVVSAGIVPWLGLLAGKVDHQVGGAAGAYLVRTGLLSAGGVLVVGTLFWDVWSRERWPRYVHGVLVVIFALASAKAGIDLAFDVTGSPRTVAGRFPGAVGVLPPWLVDVVALTLGAATLGLLLHGDVRAHVS